jgi:hypothetical protein
MNSRIGHSDHSFGIYSSEKKRKGTNEMKAKQCLLTFIIIVGITPPVFSELIIDSIFPETGMIGKDLVVQVNGRGFDENTQALLFSGDENKVYGCINISSGTFDVIVKDNIAYVLNAFEGVIIIDISNYFNPTIIDSVDTPGYAMDAAISENTLYVADGDYGLQILDISDPSNTQFIGSFDTPGFASSVAITGDTVYVADGNFGIHIIDMSTPSKPKKSFSVDTPGIAYALMIIDHTIYVSDGDKGLQIIDINNSTSPGIIGSVDTPGFAQDVTVVQKIAYIADGSSGLMIIDVNDSKTPEIIANIDTPGFASQIAICDQKAYVADEDIQIIDIHDPEYPKQIGIINTFDTATSVIPTNDFFYVTDMANFLIMPALSDIQVVHYTDTMLTLKIPSPKIAGDYELKIFNQQNEDNASVSFSNAIFISDIPDQVIAINKESLSIPVMITQMNSETSIHSYTISFHSSNQQLIPNDNIIYSDLQEAIIIKPIPNKLGSTEITVIISGENVVKKTFILVIEYPHILIDSVTPDNCSLGTACEIIIEGSGFDDHTHAILIHEDENIDTADTIHITNYSNSSLWLKIPAQNYSGRYLLKIFNPQYYDSKLFVLTGPLKIIDIPDQIRITNETFFSVSFSITEIDPEINFNDYTITVHSFTPYIISDDNLELIDISDKLKKIEISRSESQKAGTTKVRVSLTNGDITVSKYFLLTFGYPEILLEAVTPDNCYLGDECDVLVKGFGFDSATYANLIFDDEDIHSYETVQIMDYSYTELFLKIPPQKYAGKHRLRVSNLRSHKTLILNMIGPLIISDIPDQTRSAIVSPISIPFTITETEIPFQTYTMSAHSFDQEILSDDNIKIFNISDKQKEIILKPSIYPPAGTTKIRVLITDGNLIILKSFSLTFKYSKITLESVKNENCTSGNDCEITVSGSGFDASTQVIIEPVQENIIIGEIKSPGLSRGLSVSGNKAFLADEYNGLHVIDVSNPYKPKLICYIQTPGVACDVEVIDEIAYVADWDGGVAIIDIHDLFQPQIIGIYEMERAYNISIFDKKAYVNEGSNVVIIDVTNPQQTEYINTIDIYECLEQNYVNMYDITVKDHTLFIAGGGSLYYIIVNDHSKPTLVESFEVGGYGISVVDKTVYAIGNSLTVIDISDPEHPTITLSKDAHGFDIEVIDNIAYMSYPQTLSIMPILYENNITPVQIQYIKPSDTNLFVKIQGSLSHGPYQLKVFNQQYEETIDFDIGGPFFFEDIPNQTIYGNTDIFSIPFTINEANPALASQEYSINVVSSNQEVISNHNIQLDLLDSPKKILIKPFHNQFGITQISLIISNNTGLFVTEQFELTIEFSNIDLDDRQDVSDYYYLGKDLYIDIAGKGFDKNTQAMLIPVSGSNKFYKFFDYSYGITVANEMIYSRGLLNSLQILDMRNFLNHNTFGFSDMSAKGRGLTVIDNIAYITNGGLQIVDVSDSFKPEIISNFDTPGTANDVTVMDGTAYIAVSNGLQIIDVSNPFKPEKKGFIDTQASATCVAVVEKTAFVGCNLSLKIIDVSNPLNPVDISTIALPGYANSLYIIDDRAYVTINPHPNWNGGNLLIIDISNSSNPIFIDDIHTDSYLAYGNKIINNISYITVSDKGMYAIDISQPLNAQLLYTVNAPGYARDLAIAGDMAFIADHNQGICATPIPYKIQNIDINGTTISLKIPSPTISGDYVLKVFNAQYSDSLTLTFIPPFAISEMPNQSILPSIKEAIFPLKVTSTVSDADSRNYTVTAYSEKQTIIPEKNIQIEGTGYHQTIKIRPARQRYGTTPIHIIVNDGDVSIIESFNLTIKFPQISYKYLPDTLINYINPATQATDSNGFLYASDTVENCIRKYSNNEFVMQWGQSGNEYGDFNQPKGIAIDDNGFIYVADSGNHRVQIFTAYGEFITSLGEYGSGRLSTPEYINFVNNKILVSDAQAGNLQVFEKFDYTEGITKAIILAGGGPYDGNTIWSATKSCANLAYRALVYQGLNNNMIHYLSSEPETENHHVDDKATIENLKNAITQWTAGVDIADHDEALTTCADSLVIYLVDHGGDGVFRVNESEILSATVLNQWLDEIQEIIPGKLIVIYDACHSGSFMPVLSSIPDNRERIVITSTLASETAKFIGNGAISFSHYFWASILNGQDIKNAFISAQNINNFKFNDVSIFDQEPQININGNTMSNEPIDINGLQNVLIGNGKDSLTDLPVIQNISPEKTITNASSADITATGVWAQEGISSVWAQIIPENYRQTDTQKPLIALASVELHYSETTKGYIGTYDEFTHEGSYIIAVYVKDMIGIVSYPKLTKLNVQKPSERRAIIIMGETTPDSYTAINETCKLAANSLKAQAYFDDDIIMLSGKTESVNRVRSEISQCIDVQEITLYMIGNFDSRDFIFNQTEIILKEDINEWLNEINHNVPIIVIYDAPYASDYLSGLIPVDNRNRILISSTSNEKVYYFMNGSLSFSRYFWNMISNGETLYNSYFDAYNAVQTICYRRQRPQIIHGKQLSQLYGLGFGIMFGYDNPIISSVSPKQTLRSENSADIVANNVTTTRSIKKVVAIIKPPEYRTQQDNLQEIELLNISGTNNYSSAYTNFVMPGLYEMAISAIDTFGNISSPLTTTVTKPFQLYDIISGLQRMAGLDVTTKNLTYFDQHVDQFSLKDIIYMMQGLLDERDDP